MSLQVKLAVCIGLAATVQDLFCRRVSNWLCLAALLGGFVVHGASQGWAGVLSACLGAVAGFAVFLGLYLLGGMGGGDVKLMAGFGALLGLNRVPEAVLWTAGCGGLIALAALASGALRNAWRVRHAQAVCRTTHIPYAPAITLGVWLSLVPRT